MKKRFFIPACVLTVAAVVYIFYAMGHPERSLPLSSRITGVLYGLYADVLLLLFILAFCKNATILNILTIIFELASVFFIVQSILGMQNDRSSNWYLPVGLGLNCIAVILNGISVCKNGKNNSN